MTAMEQALKEAGVATRTVPERVWHYVKDHGATVCFDIAADLKIPFDRVATVARLLVKRKMLEVRQESRRVHGSKATMRYINVYSASSPWTHARAKIGQSCEACGTLGSCAALSDTRAGCRKAEV